MKKMIIVALILFPALMLWSQDNKFTKEINEQVWMTFIRSLGNGDQELFRPVHSKDVVRVIQDDGEIFGYDHYFKKIPDSLKAKWSDWKKDIELVLRSEYPAMIRPLKWDFIRRQVPIFRPVNKEKALAVFTYCYEKRMEPGKLLWMRTPGKGLRRRISIKEARSGFNCFRILAKISLLF